MKNYQETYSRWFTKGQKAREKFDKFLEKHGCGAARGSTIWLSKLAWKADAILRKKFPPEGPCSPNKEI